MGFDNPWAFLFIFALIPILNAVRRSELRTKDVLQSLKNKLPPRRFFVCRYLFITLFVSSLVIVGSNPYIEPNGTGDFVFLADTSRSMQARHSCAEPTFLDRSKEVMRDVLAGVPEGRFGVVAFDRLAFPITQMTYDHTYLKEAINNALTIGMTFQATRTDLANALTVVARKKQDLPQLYGNVRYVILLSDGYLDDSGWRENLSQATRQMQRANIRVLVVGIGNPTATPIYRTGTDGECHGDVIEIEGEIVSIPLRSDILSFVASETRGEYFEERKVTDLIRFIRSEGLADVPADGVVFGQDQRNYVGRIFLIPATIALLIFLIL